MLLTFLYKSYELCVEDTVVSLTHQYSIIHDIHLNETITKAFIYLGFTNTGSNVLSTTHTLHAAFIQLGQPSVIPPRLVLEVGGTLALQAAVPGELKSPPTWNLEVGGTSTLQA